MGPIKSNTNVLTHPTLEIEYWRARFQWLSDELKLWVINDSETFEDANAVIQNRTFIGLVANKQQAREKLLALGVVPLE